MSKKIKQREQVRYTDRIQLEGIEIPPCDRCVKENLKYVQSIHSRSCSECKRINTRCSAVPPTPSKWARLDCVEARIDYELQGTRDRQDSLAQELQKTLARQQRLEKQRASLKTKGGKMLRRGLNSLDELEAIEALEAATRSSPSTSSDQIASPDPPGLGSTPSAFADAWSSSPLAWELLDLSVGENPSQPASQT